MVAVGAWIVWEEGVTSLGPATNSTPSTNTAKPSPLTGYVGSQVCAECHADVAEEYHDSPMAHSWVRVEDSSTWEVSESSIVEDPHSPFQYQSVLEGGHLVQRETLSEESDFFRREMSADFFVGSGNHARAMISQENGYLTQLPLAWFSGKGEWRLNPGYELSNHRFERPILPGCIACHGGLANHRSPSKNRYDLPIANGIGCERCHGPGQEHIAFHRKGRNSHSANDRDPITNPHKLTAARANDVCLQCHLQGDVVIYQPGADAFSFRPGEKLSAHRLDFLIQTDQPDTFGVASHGARFMQSRCFLESGKKLTCIHCHDAHQPIRAISPVAYDAKCNACHQPAACKRPKNSSRTKRSESCVDCHMPRRRTREGQHLVFTDHWIRKPADSENANPTPPLLKPNAAAKLHSFWPDADPNQSQLGSAYIRLHETRGPQQPSLDRGLSLLESALRQSPRDEQARYWLASGKIAKYQSQAAIAHLRQLLEAKPDWPKARFRLALAYHQAKSYPQAIAEYERVIRAAPEWVEPYPLVVRLHFSAGNPKAAMRLLNQQLTHRQDAIAYVNLSLAKHLVGEPMENSQNAIDKALRLNPRLPVAHTTRAWLFAQAGKFALAKESYRRALSIDPENQEAKTGLHTLP